MTYHHEVLPKEGGYVLDIPVVKEEILTGKSEEEVEALVTMPPPPSLSRAHGYVRARSRVY